MSTPISIGSRVITRKFESNEDCGFDPRMSQFINKEDEVTAIGHNGNCCVHGYYWPPSAVELVKEKDQFYDDEVAFLNPPSPVFQPEYGKEYEFSDDPEFSKSYKGKFIGSDGKLFVGKMPPIQDYIPYQYIRKIPLKLEDRIESKIYMELVGITDTNEAKRVASILTVDMMALFNSNQSDVTDGEILKYVRANFPLYNELAAIATVRHFTTLKWKG